MPQSTVNRLHGVGVIGEVLEGPQEAITGILASTSAANNVVGRAFRHVANNDNNVTADAAGAFAGILVNPKVYANRGTTTDTLGATLTLRNNEQVELLYRGIVLVATTTAANIGDNVFFADADGQIAANSGTTLANHTQIPGAKVVRQNIPNPSPNTDLVAIRLNAI